ncbi:hypothetical protein [Haloglomus litoreum]|uniref:hypothetical protein n=1 Tax=Haloglomus litoreum TaxID=3034026 RepID=UPI0023E7AC67|nr:hypothetical protein [Haloglomus sp. DT116]
MTLASTVHASSVPLQSSFPPTTAIGWLVVLALVLFGGAYVGVCLLVAVWVRRDARLTGRARPTLWASIVGVSLLGGGLVGLFLLAAYLWSRDPSPPPVTAE